ncbi:hypothetical protein EON65_16195, partial [archaeon]
MKGLFPKSTAGSSVAVGKGEEKPKDVFRFNFFGPDEEELALLLSDGDAAKKKKKKKRSKNKGSIAEQSIEKEKSESEDDIVKPSSEPLEKLAVAVAKLNIVETPRVHEKSDNQIKVSAVTNNTAAASAAISMPAVVAAPETSKSTSSKKKNKNKKATSSQSASNTTSTTTPTPPAVGKKPTSIPPKKSGKNSQPVKEEDDLDAIIAHYISSDPPAPKSKPTPRTPRSFISPDKKVRILSPHDPELDPKLRVQAKYGKGKNLVAIGPPKIRDPRWLDVPPGFEHLAPSEVAGCVSTIVGEGAGKEGEVVGESN